MKRHARRPRAPLGLSLIELLVVLCILAVMLGWALPSYSEHVRRTHRSAAQTALLRAAHWMERATLAHGAYPGTREFPQALSEVPGGRYTIELLSPDPMQGHDLGTYRLIATPRAGTSQIFDRCGIMEINQAQQRSLREHAVGTTSADCWRS